VQTSSSIRRLSLGLAAFGLVVAVRAASLMYDRTTTTTIWMLREFGAGILLAGWGIVALLPSRWRRISIGLMCSASVATVASVMLESQGKPP
jgi:peptidoglycan/LPS O-acetylase OafA/YrhL